MRLRLVALGAAFLVVGASMVVVVLLPGESPTVQRKATVLADQLGPGSSRVFVFPATTASSASLSLSWQATFGLDVYWYVLTPCSQSTGWCLPPAPLFNWSGTTSGLWSSTGSVSAFYELWVGGNTSNLSVNFQANFLEVYHPLLLPLLPLPLGLVLGGASLLAGTGAVVAYLGLFLPAGTFSGAEARIDPPDPAAGWEELGPREEPEDPGPTRSEAER